MTRLAPILLLAALLLLQQATPLAAAPTTASSPGADKCNPAQPPAPIMTPHRPAPDLAMLEQIRPFLQRLPPGPPDPDGLIVLPYLAWGRNEQANALICQARPYHAEADQATWGYWNLLELLLADLLYHDHLTDAARLHIRRAFQQALRPDGRIARNWPGKVNTNHALTCIALGLVGGQQFDRPQLARLSEQKLDRFLDRQLPYGSFEEYNSPTYLAVDLLALATIGRFSGSHSAALKARLLERRLWLEIAGRFHLASGTLAGPYARAYYWDRIGAASDMHYALHRLLGQAVPLWLDITARYYRMDHRLSWAGRSATISYACPPWLVRRLARPAPPSLLRSTCRQADQDTDLATFLHPDLSLGTCSQRLTWHNQRVDLVARWARCRPARHFQDTRSLWTGLAVGRADWHKPAGWHFHLQDDNRVLALASPRTSTSDRPALRFLLTWTTPCDQIRIAGRPVQKLPATAGPGQVIALHDGPVYLAIRPLPTPSAQDSRLEIIHDQRSAPLLRISLPFGPAGTQAIACHGYAMELAPADQYENFQDFCRHAQQWRLSLHRDPQGLWTAGWSCPGKADLLMQVNLPQRRLVRRTIAARPVRPVAFDSPSLRQDDTGRITRHHTTLLTRPGTPALLYVQPEDGIQLAMHLSDRPGPVHLTGPTLAVHIDRMGLGQIELHDVPKPRLVIEALELAGPLTLTGTTEPPTCIINGKNLSAELQPDGQAGQSRLTLTLPHRPDP